MTIEEVLADKPVSWPFTRAMCAPISDGAGALVLCTGSALHRFETRRAVPIAACALTSSSPRLADDFDNHLGRRAAMKAYEQAGVGPTDMSLAEVHDATAFAEILQVENLGFAARGDGGRLTEEGATRLGGRIPVNPSGGLLSKGHPIGPPASFRFTNSSLNCAVRPERGRCRMRDGRSRRTAGAFWVSRRPQPSSPFWAASDTIGI